MAIRKLDGNCPGDPNEHVPYHPIRRLSWVLKKSTRVVNLKNRKNRHVEAPYRGYICRGRSVEKKQEVIFFRDSNFQKIAHFDTASKLLLYILI